MTKRARSAPTMGRHGPLQPFCQTSRNHATHNASTPEPKYSATRSQNHTGLPARCTLPMRPSTVAVRTPLMPRPTSSRPTPTIKTLLGKFGHLTMRLSGGPQTPDRRRGRTPPCRVRGAQPTAPHGPLQRLLDDLFKRRPPLLASFKSFIRGLRTVVCQCCMRESLRNWHHCQGIDDAKRAMSGFNLRAHVNPAASTQEEVSSLQTEPIALK